MVGNGGRLTCCLQGLAAGATRGLLHTLHQLEHGSNRILVSRVHVQQDTLQRKVLVGLAIRLLGTASRGETEELGESEQVVVQGLGGPLLRLLLELGKLGLVLLLQLLGEGLLEGSLLTSQAATVLLIDLEVLCQLLLELCELGLEARLLEDLSLLVCVDDLCGDELVEVLVGMASNQGIGLGSIGLYNRVLASGQQEDSVCMVNAQSSC